MDDAALACGALQQKASRVWSHLSDEWERQTGVAVPDSFSGHKKAAQIISWIFACANRRGRDFAACPLRIYQKPRTSKGQRVEVTEEQEFQVYQHINPHETPREFWYKNQFYLCLYGENFVETVPYRGDEATHSGPIAELYSWSPRFMKPIPDPKRYVAGFQMDLGDGSDALRFSPEQMIWTRYENPFDEYRGLSPLEAGKLGIEMHAAAMRWGVNTFRNQARPSVIATTVEPLTDTNYHSYLKRFEDRNTGVENAYNVMLLDHGIAAQIVQQNLKDLEYTGLLQWTRQEFLALLGVMPILVGICDETANRYNASEQIEIYWDSTIIPEHHLAEDGINNYELPRWGDRFVAEFDHSAVKALQESEGDLVTREIALLDRGVKTRNEVRQKLGLDEVKAPFMCALTADMNTIVRASVDKGQQAEIEADEETERNKPEEQPEGGATEEVDLPELTVGE